LTAPGDRDDAFKAALAQLTEAAARLAQTTTGAERTHWLAEMHAAIVELARLRNIPERLTYSVEEAALLLGVSRAFAYELVKRGEIPSVTFGRRVLIPRSALHKLIDPGDDGLVPG
jgi:excisionase family DNA binding protein